MSQREWASSQKPQAQCAQFTFVRFINIKQCTVHVPVCCKFMYTHTHSAYHIARYRIAQDDSGARWEFATDATTAARSLVGGRLRSDPGCCRCLRRCGLYFGLFIRSRSLFGRCTYTRTHADTYRYTKYSYMRLILAVWRWHKKPGKISPCANIGRVRCEYFMQADKHADTLTHTHTHNTGSHTWYSRLHAWLMLSMAKNTTTKTLYSITCACILR